MNLLLAVKGRYLLWTGDTVLFTQSWMATCLAAKAWAPLHQVAIFPLWQITWSWTKLLKEEKIKQKVSTWNLNYILLTYVWRFLLPQKWMKDNFTSILLAAWDENLYGNGPRGWSFLPGIKDLRLCADQLHCHSQMLCWSLGWHYRNFVSVSRCV